MDWLGDAEVGWLGLLVLDSFLLCVFIYLRRLHNLVYKYKRYSPFSNQVTNPSTQYPPSIHRRRSSKAVSITSWAELSRSTGNASVQASPLHTRYSRQVLSCNI